MTGREILNSLPAQSDAERVARVSCFNLSATAS